MDTVVSIREFQPRLADLHRSPNRGNNRVNQRRSHPGPSLHQGPQLPFDTRDLEEERKPAFVPLREQSWYQNPTRSPRPSPQLVSTITYTNTDKIIFNHSDTPTTRRLLIRNATRSNFERTLKIVPTSDSVVSVDARNILLKSRYFVSVNITVKTTAIRPSDESHALNIYARPYSKANHKCIQEWIASPGTENLKQRVQSLTIKVSKDYSARDTVIDLPGFAEYEAVESAEFAEESRPDCPLDRDTTTAVLFDVVDYLAAQVIDPADTRFTPKTVGKRSNRKEIDPGVLRMYV